MTVRDLQSYFGFEEPQAIYKWQRGQSLPTVDNLYALGALLDVTMDEILVQSGPKLNIVVSGQQAESCCSVHLIGSLDTIEVQLHFNHFSRHAVHRSIAKSNVLCQSCGRKKNVFQEHF